MRRSPFLLLAALALIAGCSSSSTEGGVPASTTSDPRGGVPVGYPTDVEALSPFVITAVAPDPIPVTGTDAKVHVVYELEVLNYSPRAATLTRLETLAGGPDGEVVATVEGEELAGRTLLLMEPVVAPNPEIPPGRTAVILVDDAYDTLAEVPATVTHRLSATFAPLTSEYEGRIADLWPPGDPISVIGGPVTTSTESPVVIGSPVSGSGWWVQQGCCGFSSHRAMLPFGGRINAGERFAIDWGKVDVTADATTLAAYLKPAAGGVFTSNLDLLAYGEPLLAVADGTVITVVSDIPDTTTIDALPTGVPFADLGGNTVIIDIGNGVYASYFHLAPGSPTVKVGDTVAKGQVIGRLGNSGNSLATHLHFQLQRTPAPHVGDNVPFVIDDFAFVGSLPDDVQGFIPGPNAGTRTDQLPLAKSVVDFPAAP